MGIGHIFIYINDCFLLLNSYPLAPLPLSVLMLTTSKKFLSFILLAFLFVTLVVADPRGGGGNDNDGGDEGNDDDNDNDNNDGPDNDGDGTPGNNPPAPASGTPTGIPSGNSTGLGGLQGDMQCPGSQVCIFHKWNH